MIESNKYFFTYARSKSKLKALIGPFTNKEGKIIEDCECNTQNKQYQSVFEITDPDSEITEEYIYSDIDLPPIVREEWRP